MNKWNLAAAAFVLTTVVGASAASAAVVYNNGGPNATNGNEATAWTQTEDFTFAGNTVVGGAGVYIAGLGGLGNWDHGFQYTIWSDNAGVPGALLASGSPTYTVTDSGTPWCCGGDAYLVAFNFASPFDALAGTEYHIGIHTGDVGNNNRDDIYWVTTAPNGTTTGIESAGSTYDNWANNGQEHAFFLTGAVPEPATWAMMLLGAGAVGAAMRRSRQKQLGFATAV